MIEINKITYQYKKSHKMVFTDFSLTIPKGNVCGLLGKNGAGKSTLLYLISALLRTQKGSITFNGQNVWKRKPELLQEIFIVPEEFDLPAISLQQYINTNAPFYPNFNKELMNECLKDFELTPDLNLGQLSMGQKKKVYICFALATGVQLLIMDEPSNGLDIPSKSQFRKVVSRCMTDERTILISTHQVKDVEMLLDHIIIIENSQVLLNANIGEIADAFSFEFVQGGEMPEDAIFCLPTIGGAAVVRPNTENRETQIDLEMLFNACIANPQKFNNLKK